MKLYAAKVDSTTDWEPIDEIEIEESIFLVDGYHFGDRLLEGVKFEVHFKNDKVMSIGVEESSKNYFSQLNEDFWYKEAKKSAISVLDSGDEVGIPKILEDKYFVNGRNVSYIR